MPRPTEILKSEHLVIKRMLDVLSIAADKLDKGQEVDPYVFDRSLDFIRQFADYSHHGKEEDVFFAAVEAAGMPRDAGPVGVMLEEHDEGRKAVRKMAEGLAKYRAGDTSAIPGLVRGARDYVYVLRNHIPKEDDILYPMGDEMISVQAQAKMAQQFEQVQKDRMGDRQQYYLQMVEDLEKELGVK
ncbi:MAG: hemerythrin domain-containing protein [Dehalococcoidia bacterium]|nr:hemerythrin domain-containing protein [Dehalococcoidia bacterium]